MDARAHAIMMPGDLINCKDDFPGLTRSLFVVPSALLTWAEGDRKQQPQTLVNM